MERFIPASLNLSHYQRKRSHASGKGGTMNRKSEDRLPKQGRDRTLVLDSAMAEMRDRVFGLIGPTYILDPEGRFVDWNPAFEEIIATPLMLARGQPAGEFAALGSEPAQVDVRLLQLDLPEYGTITCRRIISQIPDSNGSIHGWSIHLVMSDGGEATGLWTRIVRRLEHEITWSKYAAVYDELLHEFTDYTDLLDAVASQVKGTRDCIDLGTGTGNSALSLFNADSTRSVWAVDSNEAMLSLFRAKIEPRHQERIRVVKNDIHSMPFLEDESFDAATMVNVLYALDDPAVCLKEIYRIMKPEGILAICTPHTQTDVDRLFDRMRRVLTDKKIFDTLKDAFYAAKARHVSMDSQIHRFTIDEVHEMIDSCGFTIEHSPAAYVNAVVLIRARKRSK